MAVQLDGFNADYYNNLATVVGSSGANTEVLSSTLHSFEAGPECLCQSSMGGFVGRCRTET